MPLSKLSFVLEDESAQALQSLPEPEDESLPGDDDEFAISTIFSKYYEEYKSHSIGKWSYLNNFKLIVSHRVDIDNKDDKSIVTLEVVFDETLLDQLFQYYLFYGWRIINQVRRQAEATNDFVIKVYFGKAEKCLAYLILKRMRDIEQKARSVVINKSKVIQERLDAIINRELKISFDKNKKPIIGNTDLSKAIVKSLRDAVKAKKILSELIDRATEVKKDQGLADIIARALKNGNVGISPNDEARLNAHDVAVNEAKKATDAVSKIYASAVQVLKINCAYALLILDGLDEKTVSSDDKVESLLCNTLLECQTLVKGDLSSLSGNSVIDETFGNLVLNFSNRYDDPLPYINYNRIKGPDLQLASIGLEECADDARWRVLISDQLLSELGNHNLINRETFEYAVWGQYVTSMLIARREIEKDKEFYKKVSQGAAVVGVLIAMGILLFGSGGTASPVAGVVAAETPLLVTGTELVITLGQLSYAVGTIRDELRSIDTSLADQLTINEDSVSETFQVIGALMLTRQELVKTLPYELLKALLMSGLAGVHTLAQIAVHAYGYYQDLEMMVEITDEWMPQPSDLVCR